MIQPVIKTLIKAYIRKHPHPLDTDFDGDYLLQRAGSGRECNIVVFHPNRTQNTYLSKIYVVFDPITITLYCILNKFSTNNNIF